MSSGQKLYKRAKRIIPGGNMLLSKRPEMFLPEKWPSYFSRSKGCKVWDLDGNEFIDTSMMGIGTNILGYGHPEIDGGSTKDHSRWKYVHFKLSRRGLFG
jgi:glutamate-1-semialdehyde 2,1-aminomutase